MSTFLVLGRIPDILIVVECLGILFQFGIPFVGSVVRRGREVCLCRFIYLRVDVGWFYQSSDFETSGVQ